MKHNYLKHADNLDLFNQDFRHLNSLEAEKQVDKERLHTLILKAMKELSVPVSFRDIARHLKLKDENIWKRLSEMERKNLITTAGKRKDSGTGRNVSLWKIL